MGQALDNEAAARYGQFVDAAYQTFAADPNNLTPKPQGIPNGWKMVAWIQMSDFAFGNVEPKFYGLIAQDQTNADSFVLAIRGTEGTIEWWDDAHCASVPFDQVPNAGRVAEGFDHIYDTLKVVAVQAPTLEIAAPAQPTVATFAEQVAQAVRSSVPPRPPGLESLNLSMPWIAVTGHSLGAALCTLYVMENAVKKIINNLTVCTFGSPRVGNKGFAQAFNALGLTSWRIVNAPDLVPNLPPDTFGYVHVDSLCLFNSTGRVKSSLGCAHAIATYLSLLDPTLKPSQDCIAQSQDAIMLALPPLAPVLGTGSQATERHVVRSHQGKTVSVSTPNGNGDVNISINVYASCAEHTEPQID